MKVIIAVDGSKCSLTALESVVDRPWPADVEFKILSVVEPTARANADWQDCAASYLDEIHMNAIKEAKELVSERVAVLKRELPHNKVIGKVITGDVRDAIVREAHEWSSDFIVMGSHGCCGMRRFVIGSVAEAVETRAPCSVEIIRDEACIAAAG